MKTRKKTKAEIDHDKRENQKSTENLISKSLDFIDTFFDCEGEVWFSDATKMHNAAFHYKHNKEILAADKVGDTWDMDNGIIGKYRYENI